MILNADAKSLEIVCCAQLSKDQLLIDELISGADIHSLNQAAFHLPEGKAGRLIAKILVFRIIYGGTEYSFAQDPDFTSVSSSQKYWKKVIDKFYDKYKGIARWHESLMQQATRTGKLVMPTGREYSFRQNDRGDWPRTTILNYPVQGYGADLMAIIRVAFYKRFKQRRINGLIVSSVHDSIVCDLPEESITETTALFHEVFKDGTKLYNQWFKDDLLVPLRCEVSVGQNMNDLTEIK